MSEDPIATPTGERRCAGHVGHRQPATDGTTPAESLMQLAQARLVTEDVRRLATFYARLIGAPVVLNDYYVEVGAGAIPIGFSRCRYTEFPDRDRTGGAPSRGRDQVVLDLLVDDVDGEYDRVDSLGVEWVLAPTTQPWGARSMVFRDPDGNLVNVFSRSAGDRR